MPTEPPDKSVEEWRAKANAQSKGTNAKLAILGVAAALIIGGGIFAVSSGTDSRESPKPKTAAERNNAQADREQDTCFKQADRIANQQGADAGSAKLDECVSQYADSLQVP